jgi:16S rRNA (uracil1498-N3)-methyltransferase
MKQSLKAYKPILNQLSLFDKFIAQNHAGNRLIAHCLESERFELIKIKPALNDFTIFIGPEGDFTDLEIQSALKNKFLPVNLGKSRLRTETAGVVSCQIIADLMSFE